MAERQKILSAREVLSILASFGFVVHRQRGSHIKVRRETASGAETLTVPNHKVIAKGTLKAIYNQASRYISPSELHGHFYRK